MSAERPSLTDEPEPMTRKMRPRWTMKLPCSPASNNRRRPKQAEEAVKEEDGVARTDADFRRLIRLMANRDDGKERQQSQAEEMPCVTMVALLRVCCAAAAGADVVAAGFPHRG